MNLSFKKRVKFLIITLLTAFASTVYPIKKTKNPAFIVTGFEPYHGDKSNPSWDAVQLLPDQIGGIPLVKIEIPVSYARSYHPLQKAIQQYDTIGVLSVGVADINGLSIEQSAYNLDDDIWPDNDNITHRGQLIISNGPSTLKIINSFPIDKIVANLTEQGFVINKSNTSWRFLCNHVFYMLLNQLNNQQIPAGFMHVPNISYYNVSQDKIALEKSIKIILESMTTHLNDLSEHAPGPKPSIRR